MTHGEGQWNDLPREVRETLREYLNEMTALFDSTLEAVILYGSAARGDFLPGRSNLNLLLLLTAHDGRCLSRYAKVHRRWSKKGIVVPLFVTEQELQDSLALYPLEYLELSRYHLMVAGRDPFVHLHSDLRHLSVQCLQEIRGNLLRIRQRFVEGGATPDVIHVLLPLSITALLPCLRGLAQLLDWSAAGSVEDLLGAVGTRLGMDGAPLLDAWRLKTGSISPGHAELPRLFDRYVSTLSVLGEQAAKALSGSSQGNQPQSSDLSPQSLDPSPQSSEP